MIEMTSGAGKSLKGSKAPVLVKELSKKVVPAKPGAFSFNPETGRTTFPGVVDTYSPNQSPRKLDARLTDVEDLANRTKRDLPVASRPNSYGDKTHGMEEATVTTGGQFVVSVRADNPGTSAFVVVTGGYVNTPNNLPSNILQSVVATDFGSKNADGWVVIQLDKTVGGSAAEIHNPWTITLTSGSPKLVWVAGASQPACAYNKHYIILAFVDVSSATATIYNYGPQLWHKLPSGLVIPYDETGTGVGRFAPEAAFGCPHMLLTDGTSNAPGLWSTACSCARFILPGCLDTSRTTGGAVCHYHAGEDPGVGHTHSAILSQVCVGAGADCLVVDGVTIDTGYANCICCASHSPEHMIFPHYVTI